MKVNDLNPYRFGRRPGEQDPCPLSGNQSRVEKLVTGKLSNTRKPKPNNIATSTNGMRLRKEILTIGTWNARTLWETGKLDLLRNELKRFRYNIIGVSEIRWTGKGETTTGDFIWSGEENIHANGVGFLLSKKAKNALIGYNPVSSRVITARFNATPFKITAIHVYAPTSASSDEEIEAFYNSIENTLAEVPKKDLILMSGDWNAKVGNDNTGWNSVMDFAPRLNLLRSHDGNLLQSKEAIKKRWTQYCSNLYKDNGGGDIIIKELEQISPPIQQESHDILFSEVEQAIQSLKKNKSPGLDGIQAELLQSGGESLAYEIHKLCNKIWHSEAIPEDWG
ncbi:unnamed protein product, partial [Rotaria sp. Silwood2]